MLWAAACFRSCECSAESNAKPRLSLGEARFVDTTQKLSLLHGLSPLAQSALSNSFISSLREVVVELLVYVVRSCSHRPAGEEPGFHSQETANLP